MAEKETMQSVSRVFQLLEYMAENNPLGVRDLHVKTGINTTTVHRMLSTLVELGYVHQIAETGKYTLTYKMAALGNMFVERNDVVNMAHPHLVLLSEKCNETVHFVDYMDTKVRYIDKIVPRTGIYSMQSYIGLALPVIKTAAGKAMLAELTDDEVRDLWSRSEEITQNNDVVPNFTELLEELKAVRRNEYALDNEELEAGIACIGVCITGHDGRAKYGVSVSGPAPRLQGKNIEKISRHLIETKRILTTVIGH